MKYFLKKDMWYYVYVLYIFSRKGLYVGFTDDMKRRIPEHRRGKVKSTRSKDRKPELIFYEAYKTEKEARRRERYLKTSKGKRTLKLMIPDTIKNVESNLIQ